MNRQKEKKPIRYIEGTLRITGKGVGYVVADEFPEGIEVSPADLNMGLHRDRVRVLLEPKVAGERQSGEITEILFRYKIKFVGTVKRQDGLFFLVPDDPKMYADIIIPPDEAKHVQPNEKVYVKIVKWTDPKLNPLGTILSSLGNKGDNDVEMRAIVLEKGLSSDFPPGVEEEARRIDRRITEEEVALRRDMRAVTTFTIDPADAKDFDDALSFRELPSGDIEIGIHIADVTHYVRPGSKIDAEAAERATSIYLVDRTIPMLPEVLSNDACSLNPNEDKLVFSAIFTFSGKALANKEVEIVDEWFGRAIIHSDKRFTYEEAQGVLDTKKGSYCTELERSNAIAKLLQKERFARGAIAFEKEEVRFELDEFARPIAVHMKERTDTNKLIEDFMLLANKRVAEFISKKDKHVKQTFVYRVHDLPDADKVKELASFLKTIGYELKIGKNGVTSRDINKLLTDIKGTEEEGMIQTATIRTMAKAVYATKNIGHFGLSFEHYTHFTSPIRRYPDMMVHRLLATYLENKKVPAEALERYEAASRYSSEREQTAAEAERGSIKYKQVEYMKDKVGQTFDGIISGVTKWGLYVEEAESRAEGLVHIKNMADDYYTLDEKTYSLRGERTKKKYTLGDKVRIKVKSADLEKRMLDYAFT